MCVHRDFRSQKLIRPLIQTHEYRQRVTSGASGAFDTVIKASVFRCDNDLHTSIIPLTQGMSYTYSLKQQHHHLHGIKENVSTTKYHIIRVDPKSIDTMNLFTDFILSINANAAQYEVYMTPSLENLIALMNAGILYIYALVLANQYQPSIVGLYFFKNICTTYEILDDEQEPQTELKNTQTFPGSRTIHCFGTICCNGCDNAEFSRGFILALKRLIRASRGQFNVLVLDGIGASGVLLNCLSSPFLVNEFAYYAYNWRIPGMPLLSNKCLFVI
jgi:hypothetical protein